MTNIILPFEDHDGTLSALVAQAVKDGAKAHRDQSNIPDSTFNLTFPSKKAADAFAKAAGLTPVTEEVEPGNPAAE